MRRLLLIGLVVAIALTASTALSTAVALRVPTTTGAHAVGRTTALLADPTRPIPVTTWYPAVAGSGTPGAYVADLDRIRDGLVASGSLGSAEVLGLGFVRDDAREDATPTADRSPVLVFSPGNATNVAFYAGLAEELASHGYVVVGIDHPSQVAAADLGDRIAVYAGDPPLSEAASVTVERIDQRVADVEAVLDALTAAPERLGLTADQLDLDRIGVLGHSNGGVTAALTCRADDRVDACLNLDGQLGGGPLGARPDAVVPPTKPFLYLTKEPDLAAPIQAAFEQGTGAVRVVVAGAAHDQFADGARFVPRALPGTTTADAVLTVTRAVTLAFFDDALRDPVERPYDGLAAPLDLRIEVYPLARR